MLISLPTPSDLLQVSRWHDQQAAFKSRRAKSRTKNTAGLERDVLRHQRIANQLRNDAKQLELGI